MTKIEQIIEVNTATVESKADVIFVNGEVFTYKNSGLTRRVFVNEDKTLVVKVPVDTQSQIHNDAEITFWDEASDEIKPQLAETKRLPNGWVIQEYLHTLDDPETEEWLGRPLTNKELRFAASCRSDVGFDNEGNIKCYDLEEYKQW
jgi:hypothetical protein